MPEPKKSSVVRLAAQRRPIAYDRHFRTPIIKDPLEDESRYGEFVEYSKDPTQNRVADEFGVKDYISLNPYLLNDPPNGLYDKVLKHELVHVLQSKARKEGKRFDLGNDPRYQQIVSGLTTNADAGETEAPAYLLGRDLADRSGVPQNPQLDEVLRQRILQRLIGAGYGKYTNIWK